MDKRTYLTFMHISQFAGMLLPLAGLLVPLFMWLSKKDEDYEVDLHGRIIMNWIVSELIYLMVSGILIIVIVGIPLMIAVGVCSIVFPILGAIKVSEGGVYVYPISIDFFGVKRRLF